MIETASTNFQLRKVLAVFSRQISVFWALIDVSQVHQGDLHIVGIDNWCKKQSISNIIIGGLDGSGHVPLTKG